MPFFNTTFPWFSNNNMLTYCFEQDKDGEENVLNSTCTDLLKKFAQKLRSQEHERKGRGSVDAITTLESGILTSKLPMKVTDNIGKGSDP